VKLRYSFRAIVGSASE